MGFTPMELSLSGLLFEVLLLAQQRCRTQHGGCHHAAPEDQGEVTGLGVGGVCDGGILDLEFHSNLYIRIRHREAVIALFILGHGDLLVSFIGFLWVSHYGSTFARKG